MIDKRRVNADWGYPREVSNTFAWRRGLNRAAWVIPIILGLGSAVCFYVFNLKGELTLHDWSIWVLIGLFMTAYFLVFAVIERLAAHHTNKVEPGIDAEGGFSKPKVLPLRFVRRDILVAFLVVILCWLPYIIYSYPGVLWYDTINQITWFLGGTSSINLQHPVATTLLFGVASQWGAELTGNYYFGLFGLALIQSMFAAGVLAGGCCYLSRFGIVYKRRLGLLGFFALFPFFPAFFSTLAKDTLFVPPFVLLCLSFIALAKGRGGTTSSSAMVAYAIAVSLCLLTRKSAFIIVVGSTAALLLYVQGMRTKALLFLSCAVSLILSSVIFPGVVKVWRGVIPDGRQETLSVPLQQVANVVRSAPDILSGDDRAIIDACYLMGYEGIPEAYSYDAADGVKQYSEPEGADYQAFMRLWLRLGLEKPVLYLGAYAGLVAGWFVWDNGISIVPLTSQSDANQLAVSLSGWDAHEDSGVQMARWLDGWAHFPVVGALFSRALWSTALPGLLLYLVFRRSASLRNDLIILSPVLLLVASLMVGPTSLYQESVRYIAPLVAVLPLIASIIFLNIRSAACIPKTVDLKGGDCE